jgi:hypothetical protein
MPTNFYFRNGDARNEQKLIEDLVVESIKQYGFDCRYLPRTITDQDTIIRDVQNSSFLSAIPLEFYIKNVENFGGMGDFASKFGHEINDSMTLVCSRRSFKEELTALDATLIRPREGDLIFFPLNRKLFEIKFVEHEAPFYQMGSLQCFELSVELFEYNQETFNTGIPEIDVPYSLLDRGLANNVPANITLATDLGQEVDSSGMPIFVDMPDLDESSGDPQGENFDLQNEANTILDFSESNPFGEP